MSSAYEEADDGPVYDDSEEQVSNNVNVQNTNDDSIHERITPRPQQAEQPRGPVEEEEEEEAEAEGDMSIGDHIHSKNGLHIGDEQLRGPILSRDSTPEIGRPSSADGSLSIPDDTPSIQVSNGIACCQLIELMSFIIGFFNILARQTRSFLRLWPKSYPFTTTL